MEVKNHSGSRIQSQARRRPGQEDQEVQANVSVILHYYNNKDYFKNQLVTYIKHHYH